MAVVTTGFFDGVHLGHRLVLDTLVSAARERGEEALVLTFWPHPRTVLQQDARDFRLLTSLEEKRALLAACGVGRVEVLPFTRAFAALTAREYLSLLKERFGASLVVMGYDNRIGCDRKTAADLLSEGFPLQTVDCLTGLSAPEGGGYSEPVAARGHVNGRGPDSTELRWKCISIRSDVGDGRDEERSDEGFRDPPPSGAGPTSSTKIRKALDNGEIDRANAMLGYRYGLYGVVVAGNRVGRTIGFPTANMQLYEPLKLVPANGVYAVETEVMGRPYKGMCNIGTRPTVGGTTRTIETHILDFDEDIYGLPLQVRFVRRIRDERRFPSLELLRTQLERDREAVGRKISAAEFGNLKD